MCRRITITQRKIRDHGEPLTQQLFKDRPFCFHRRLTKAKMIPMETKIGDGVESGNRARKKLIFFFACYAQDVLSLFTGLLAL